ncbi:Helicase ARIP4 [Dissostichus eleginoides]|uniref:Helicase ARIP4 n=1 Tax=Dissostichus eleginoides TaxID=100907 RepID=A0AAD9FI99_DISEL|nr:Helicase ARIP4 [Dissostichus eleginoides]
MRGSKRRSTESQGNTPIGGKRSSSAASRYPGLSMGSSGLSFPPGGLNSSSLLGNMGHMSHPLLMGGSGGSSFLQTPGQTLADLQTMFTSAGSDLLRQPSTGNGHLPTPSSSSSSMSPVYSSASATIPMSSTPSAATSSSLASGSLPPYLMNPNMADLLSSGFPLNYSQSLLSDSRMFSSPLLSGGFQTPNSSSNTSSFLSHFNNPTSSLLGAALTQPDIHQSTENGGSSSDDDVIEVTGQ